MKNKTKFQPLPHPTLAHEEDSDPRLKAYSPLRSFLASHT